MSGNSIDARLAKKRNGEIQSIKHLWKKLFIHPYTSITLVIIVLVFVYNDFDFRPSIEFIIFIFAEYLFVNCLDDKIKNFPKNNN